MLQFIDKKTKLNGDLWVFVKGSYPVIVKKQKFILKGICESPTLEWRSETCFLYDFIYFGALVFAYGHKTEK